MNNQIQQLNKKLKNQIKAQLQKITPFLNNLNSNRLGQSSSLKTISSSDNTHNEILYDLSIDDQVRIYKDNIDYYRKKLSKYNILNIERMELDIKAYEEIKKNILNDYNSIIEKWANDDQKLKSYSIITKLKGKIQNCKSDINQIKEENKINKESNSELEGEIKSQEEKKISLLDKIKNIEQNIDFKINQNEADNNIDTQSLRKMELNYNENQKILEIEQMQYEKEIKSQNKMINDLKLEINDIAVRLSKYKQFQRINQIKLKEKYRFKQLIITNKAMNLRAKSAAIQKYRKIKPEYYSTQQNRSIISQYKIQRKINKNQWRNKSDFINRTDGNIFR